MMLVACAREIRATEAAHQAALKLGTGWQNIAAFGAAIDRIPVIAIASDLCTTLQAAAQASAGKTDFGVLLTDIVSAAAPVSGQTWASQTLEATLHPVGSPAVKVRVESFTANRMYYRLVAA
jgi:hypothetical protein